MSAVKDFKCNGCGAPLPIPRNSKGRVKCPSCKTECIIEGLVKNAEIAAKENINSGFPLFASPSTLHRILIDVISGSPYMPLDVLDKVEVISEERYCVPAYCFYCNGMASFTYEVGNERSQTYTVDKGDHVEVREKTRIEWSPASSSVAVSSTIFASGNRRLAPIITKLYSNFDPNKLIDIEELDFPADVQTFNYDLPQPAAFTEYVAPVIEEILREKAEYTVSSQNVRNLTIGGTNIQKETLRVFFGLYHIVYKFNGQEYSVWVKGDGSDYCYDELPVDQNRKSLYLQKQQELESIPLKTGGFKIGLWVCVIAALFTKGISLIGAVVFGVLIFLKKKEYNTKVEQAKSEIHALDAQAADAVQEFKAKKQALNGIYSELTGDASAF